MARYCAILPAHVLQAIANSAENPQHVQGAAQTALQFHQRVTAARKEYIATTVTQLGTTQPADAFIPSHIVAKISDNAHAQGSTQGAAGTDATQRVNGGSAPLDTKSTSRTVCDFNHALNENFLPGKMVREDSQNETHDVAVNQAYDNVGEVLKFYKEKLGLDSFDGKDTGVVSSVHFGKDFVNAYWDLDRRQMIFGDGNDFIYNFTASVDVIAHEISHALTNNICPLEYEGQSGALNEHLSDVFGVMVRQTVKAQTAEQADWLIGEDCLFPGVHGVGLRSFKAPGTAYNDPRIDKDIQVANASEFCVTEDDNGGVHKYSGIPNKAFYLAATAFGGYTWEMAGQIWWSAMKSGQIPSKCSFQQFADLTTQCAAAFGDNAAKTVRKAWDDVGVVQKV